MEIDTLIYIASLIDSQATISIRPHQQSYYTLTMSIYHREVSILELVQNFFEAGKIRTDRKNYQLQFGAWDTYKVLKAVLPHLKIKTDQANLAIEFQTRKEYRTKPLSDEELQFRKECYEKMKALKTRK